MAEDDWRKSVPQAKRSEQIRYISAVLSAAEPGSTPAQKLMLSMRFEDNIFKTSKSYDDYQRKLVKRLKKVQKNYKPPASNGQGNSNGGMTMEEMMKKDEIKLEMELRETFGDKMKFIVENSSTAVYILKVKQQQLLKQQGISHSSNSAENLKKNTDKIAQWAIDIGVFPESHVFSGGIKRHKNKFRKAGELKALKKLLTERVENIRQHILKTIDANKYLEEEWAKSEKEMNDDISEILSTNAIHIIEVQKSNIKTFIEKASVPVPALRRGKTEDIKEATLLQIQKVRAATEALLTYLSTTNKEKKQPELTNILRKMHIVSVEGLQFLSTHCKRDPTKTNKKKLIKLEDAWTKLIKYESSNKGIEMKMNEDMESSKKRRRMMLENRGRIIVRTRVLLQPGQKTPSYILQALKAKNVQIIRNTEVGAGARIKMNIGSVFEINIFFSPLLVSFHPLEPISLSSSESTNETTSEDSDGLKKKSMHSQNTTKLTDESEFRRYVVDGGFPTWKSSSSALMSTYNLSYNHQSSNQPSPIDHFLISRKLEYASAHATHILRRCFSDMTSTTKESDTSASIEIAETSALMKFILLTRVTFLNEDG